MRIVMKGAFRYILSAVGLSALLVTCSMPYGSVSEHAVKEALASPQLAITPRIPGWLLAKKDIYRLDEAQMNWIRGVLTPDKVREVSEEYYRSETQGNRKDDSPYIFYLYAQNGQSLGGRLIGNKVLMDDFNLSEQETTDLYALLKPQLIRIFPNVVH